ncbi:FHA domain-containing protein [Leifsonia poae]|uniref:FHA domain-containing protein n=1 Tax=Leifsonia poae TaxID=110933 RepID=UPI003D67BE97
MFEVQQTTAGGWAVAVAGERALLVEAASGDRLHGYRAALATGFAETLEALAADGFARTPAFALADVVAGQALIAVRGSASATVVVGGTERAIDAAGVSTWSEQQVAGVSAVTLAASGQDALLPPLPLGAGIVWGAAVSWPAVAGRDTDAADHSPKLSNPAQAPITEPVALEAEAAGSAPVAEVTISAPAEATGYDHLFGATMMRSVEDAAVRPDEVPEESQRIDIPGFVTDSIPAASEREGDHDGMTVFSGSLDGLRDRDRPAVEAAAESEARFYVDLFDGRREYLQPPIVVGRAPVASTTSRGPVPRPITVTSEEQDISRSHASIAVEGDSVVVTDLHSRNGTIVVLPGKAPQKLRQGEPTTVITGTVVDLGSGVTLTVGQDA